MAFDTFVRGAMIVFYAALLTINWGMWWRNRDWSSWREGVYLTAVAILLSMFVVSMAFVTLI